MSKKEWNIGVLSAGIEPAFSASEANVLSIKRRERTLTLVKTRRLVKRTGFYWTLGVSLFLHAETDPEGDRSDDEMEEVIRHVVGHQAKNSVTVLDEAEDHDDGVDDAEDAEVHPRGVRRRGRGPEGDDAREEMDDVMRRIDMEDAEQVAVHRDTWNESEDADENEHDTECPSPFLDAHMLCNDMIIKNAFDLCCHHYTPGRAAQGVFYIKAANRCRDPRRRGLFRKLQPYVPARVLFYPFGNVGPFKAMKTELLIVDMILAFDAKFFRDFRRSEFHAGRFDLISVPDAEHEIFWLIFLKGTFGRQARGRFQKTLAAQRKSTIADDGLTGQAAREIKQLEPEFVPDDPGRADIIILQEYIIPGSGIKYEAIVLDE